ncbi:alpha-amylase family glycosyl hydrolase [Sphingomonas sp. SM33]|uniref:Alpha-amylase family glycosyl hydrolase n=1 Tax=Sphingomonas telluris TaxID=2907998 RepID=A0ABS9VQ87_9SPHN|nr:alpha-amylase family glycosyl hydrolase [Sphingomonas telluris]MCH8617123.1 alpha-amylase family glycosyl hydrolase [Sphingomonas telluris]
MVILTMLAAMVVATPPAADYRARQPEDEVIYFLLPDRFDNGDPANDRGGLKGDRLTTGFDPTAKGFFHGGDLKGVIKRLDYIQGLGATAVWVAPVFQNKAVQGAPGHESAGYHGYWITDFTEADSHLGTNKDFKALVDAVHARGMKFYMDIVVNHTADVIQLEGCKSGVECPYRSIADYPFQRRGGVDGTPINPGFDGANFEALKDPNYAYTVSIPPAERNVKVPAWLNDPIYYHNRGNSTFRGESSLMGDFFGLDDVYTEHPRVIEGMIEIYGKWIDDFAVDGFRIDTAQHVNPEFWQKFVPAMLARAKGRGIPNFHIFGEVSTSEMDPAHTAVNTRVDKLPNILDFAFGRAVIDTVAGQAGTDELAKLFRADPLYEGGADAARRNPTFLGNHDAGRFPALLKIFGFKGDDAELFKRDILGHAMLLTLRGVPTIYSGDEQGFVGKGGDQDARQDMFASRVATYNEDKLLGTASTTARENFATDHPMYREIAKLAQLRTSHAALTRGRQVVRYSQDKPGLFAVSRLDPSTGREMLLLFNTSTSPVEQNVVVEVRSAQWDTLAGTCSATASAPGSVRVNVPALGYAVCNAR